MAFLCRGTLCFEESLIGVMTGGARYDSFLTLCWWSSRLVRNVAKPWPCRHGLLVFFFSPLSSSGSDDLWLDVEYNTYIGCVGRVINRSGKPTLVAIAHPEEECSCKDG